MSRVRVQIMNQFDRKSHEYSKMKQELNNLIFEFKSIYNNNLEPMLYYFKFNLLYKAIKRYWKLIQQDSRKLSDKRFYRPTFRLHLTSHNHP